MPHRPINKEVDLPAWVNKLEDTCLAITVMEALFARDSAIKAGALDNEDALEILKSGDATIDQIAYGRYHGQVACKKAADALRKYQQALDKLFPMPRRHRGRRPRS